MTQANKADGSLRLYPNDPAQWKRVSVPGRFFTYYMYAKYTEPDSYTDVLTLYVGKTDNVHRRFSQHRTSKAWWPLVDHMLVAVWDNPEQAASMEAHGLRHGLFNVIGNRHGH